MVRTSLNVLLVEDDYHQAGVIKDTLERAFPNVQVMDPIKTEAEFCSKINTIERDPPNVIIMDVMLRWTDPGPDMREPPDKVKNEGYVRAGLRCTEMLLERDTTRNIPVILFTVLGTEDLEAPPDDENVVYISKESEPEELVDRMRSIISREPPPT